MLFLPFFLAPPEPILKCAIPVERVVYPEVEVTFTCIAVDSIIVSWISEEYIGSSREIQFSVNDAPGSNETCQNDPNTIATLIDNSVENGVPVLTSQLNITVLWSTIPHSKTVTCVNSALGTRKVFNLREAGM